MAFASVGTLGTGSSSSGGTSVAITTSATAEAGNLVVLIVALDNHSTSDQQTTEISSISDSGSNSWTKAGEYCNGQFAANDGATVSVWFSKLTTQIASGGTITATLANSKTYKCLTAWEFTVGSGTIQTAGTLQTEAVDSGDPGSMALSGLTSKEYLFVRGTAVKTSGGGTPFFTPTASHTEFTEVGAANEMAAVGEFRILTGTGDTSNPSNTGSWHNASVFFALEEASNNGFFAFF